MAVWWSNVRAGEFEHFHNVTNLFKSERIFVGKLGNCRRCMGNIKKGGLHGQCSAVQVNSIQLTESGVNAYLFKEDYLFCFTRLAELVEVVLQGLGVGDE